MEEAQKYTPWKVVAVADSLQIGHLMVSFLASEDIPARIQNEASARYDIIGAGSAMRGTRIEVQETNFEEAALTLEERKSGNFRFSDDALEYWAATRGEIEEKISEHAPLGPTRGGIFRHWKLIGCGVSMIGLVFGLSTAMDALSTQENDRRAGAFIAALSAFGFIGIALSGRSERQSKEH